MLRVAGIGVGDLGRLELSLLSDIDGVEVVAGADPSHDARAAFAHELSVPTYEDYEELLAEEDVDAACIVTPHTLHYEQAKACLERDVHVHLEKPMVTDIDHAHDLIDRAEARNLVLAVGYQRHFDPRFREIQRLVDAGRIGDVHMAACHLEQVWIRWTKDQWRGNPALSGGGQLYDSGSHLLDALLWSTRSTPVSVAATVDNRGHDVDVNSALAATLEREDGDRITASIGVSGAGQSTPAPGEMLTLLGTEGTISFDGETIEVTEGGTTYTATPNDPGFDAVTRRKLENFVDAIRGDVDLDIPAEDALKVTALTEAAYDAAETGQTVDVQALLDRS
ncbi:Predicted dehydrogenase [Halogranum gelatinilyticum]|uniref:Predicted dehydrogenase n=1 Tax=Halogranum gelatinilyticum TaxID=660521 RepID=A0A1G9R8C3_9EURY|nr:Gfo/Idh/MocA family oxidoreductase [Halogranum gelatinilyticum]SDM19380.1 Predicted dehydrogenase [Halogranum gelatinilyticum]